MKTLYLSTIAGMCVVIIALLFVVIYQIRSLKDVKEDYYLADYYKLRQCRCVPQYDNPTFTNY